ncbi:hypothetical protein VCUG_00715 [Vavraia culicis subsp. floridensis]|uniref:Uncharacterized protein n=1 Tax=Vavraia culicis (isolate floridensis) TaxID=948595 RepID=L2GVU1_VAVCU|nr:uncharacterized protein VCUG_00715 [Vavraia culicis subsp. floridensis]ELA47754.1 hypothetical protein VCUG_00715 [Vavraia culicis subsp. floridensis]
MTVNEKEDFNFLEFKSVEDPIKSMEMLQTAFVRFKQMTRDELAMFFANKNFFIFLKDAFLILKNDREFLDFVRNLEIDDQTLEKHEMNEFMAECAEARKKVDAVAMVDDENPSKRKKKAKRVSFSLEKNMTKLFLVEKTDMKHGNYRDKDREEAAILKNMPWIVPIKLRTCIEYKTRSEEVEVQRIRETTTVRITNLDSENFVPSDESAKREKTSATTKPVEISIFDLNVSNILPKLDYTKIVCADDEVKYTVNDVLNDKKVLEYFLEKKNE